MLRRVTSAPSPERTAPASAVAAAVGVERRSNDSGAVAANRRLLGRSAYSSTSGRPLVECQLRGLLDLSDRGHAEQRSGHRHGGSFAVQAIASAPGRGRRLPDGRARPAILMTAMRLLVVVQLAHLPASTATIAERSSAGRRAGELSRRRGTRRVGHAVGTRMRSLDALAASACVAAIPSVQPEWRSPSRRLDASRRG